MSSLTAKAEDYVDKLFREELPRDMIFHNLVHTRETVEACEEIAKACKVSDHELEILLLAAWFHDTGFVEQYEDHEEASKRIAEKFLKSEKADQKVIKEVLALIDSTKFEMKPANELEEILRDADHVNMGKKKFFERSELLRYEWKNYMNKEYREVDWERIQLDYLQKSTFYTKYAFEKYNERREKNLNEQLERVAEAEKKKAKNAEPSRGIETMYRAVYNSHINLSSIADSKANMLISINTIIMSIILAGIGSGFTFSGQSFVQHVRFTLPISILLIGCLSSVIFAIISASPKVTNKKVTVQNIKDKKYSSLFFGNYTILSLEEFITQMNLLRSEKDLIYNSMSIDIYYLGKVLKKKYNLLQWAYMIFMLSLLISVLGFLVIFLYTF